MPFQNTDLSSLQLTREECSKEAIAILDGTTFRGAAAVAALLHARGNRFLAAFIAASGFIGRASYRWIASHRGSFLVKLLTKILERKLAQ